MKTLLLYFTLILLSACNNNRATTLVDDFFQYTQNGRINEFVDIYNMEELSNKNGLFIELEDTLINVKKIKSTATSSESYHLTLRVNHISKEKCDEIINSNSTKYRLEHSATIENSNVENYQSERFRYEITNFPDLTVDAYERLND